MYMCIRALSDLVFPHANDGGFLTLWYTNVCILKWHNPAFWMIFYLILVPNLKMVTRIFAKINFLVVCDNDYNCINYHDVFITIQ